jgi:hypothetical protein
MNRHLHGLGAVCSGAALMALGTVSLPTPAHAQFGGIAGMILGHIGGVHISAGRGGGGGGCGRRCGGGGDSRHRSSHSDDSSSSSDDESKSRSRKDRDDRVLASLAPPPSTKVQNDVLKSVYVSSTLGEVGTTKDVSALGKTSSKEAERDWTDGIKKIIEKFTTNQDKRVTTPGDVTEHAIEQSLDAAIKNAKLGTFESFLGENWTGERLRVKVLDRVRAELDRLFEGNNRGYAPMDQLDSLIQRSAQATYRRVFEVSELLAANRSSSLFMQRLYQTHGDLLDARLREVADDTITRASNTAIGKFEAALRQDQDGYALHYRAQRIVFDCLSENVERISSSETAIATTGEIEKRIEDTAKNECVGWLDHQFGSNNRSLQPQKPMPVRVVWSADGPKDDPSMYGRATDGF